MRMRKRALLGLALATALIPVAASTALADGTQPTYSRDNPGNCPSGFLCVYRGINYDLGGWGVAKFEHSNPVWSSTINGYIAHQDSSWFNNGTGTSWSSVVVYSDNNYTGKSFCLDKGWGNKWDPIANDQGESNQWIQGTC
ncbi:MULTISPECIES: peptidase inhibitor family I36 protein [Streptomyces]|uniref:Peptidase inhibitor family I36 protein n=1 Tax=Streptomyces fuscus TaxID=3048495 RepID=A0ABT7IVV2_9ACTN|nr:MULTISPECIES: peptidase inhibitor family I36 protein [Streptomyces]MCM1976568.1 peptidase inhibitor family I36 protein [Streptomyces sp. G1]MDL2075568.1 peptidase inhibitor family I36 protein [Streptomyces fuscus]